MQAFWEHSSKDPLGRVEYKLTSLVKATDWPDEGQPLLKPKSAQSPHMYGVPKIHKADIPFYPIVSTTGVPIYEAAKYLSSWLKPMHGKSKYHVKRNPAALSELIDILHIYSGDPLVSSLFMRD